MNGLTEMRLRALSARLSDERSRFIGFPAALDFDAVGLEPIMRTLLNNVGDPFVRTWHGMNTKDFEQEVIAFFAKLFRAPEDGYWGYVTNGSTECNLYALYVAREKYPAAPVYYSSAAHYSVPKNVHLLGMRGVVVPAQPSGEMDYAALQQLAGAQMSSAAIVVATIGTTMTEARDSVTSIQRALQAAGVRESHVHADGALAGAYAGLLTPRWPFDFQDGASSVNVSGHKFLGSPMPSGVVIVKRADIERVRRSANYTGSIDRTISGSRNGHLPLILWHAIQRWGVMGFKHRAEQGLALAAYAHAELQRIGWDSWRNPQALTVMLAAPPEQLIFKWQLATADGWSHVICMPGVRKAMIDAFVADLGEVRPH
uniref:Histidine decarboxylase n=1 Tax=Pandoraea thiooxydans TaxID=445709 RepID=A0A0G3EUA9_9BURK